MKVIVLTWGDLASCPNGQRAAAADRSEKSAEAVVPVAQRGRAKPRKAKEPSRCERRATETPEGREPPTTSRGGTPRGRRSVEARAGRWKTRAEPNAAHGEMRRAGQRPAGMEASEGKRRLPWSRRDARGRGGAMAPCSLAGDQARAAGRPLPACPDPASGDPENRRRNATVGHSHRSGPPCPAMHPPDSPTDLGPHVSR